MILPDANLLLYACDSSSPFHAKASAWCEQLMVGLDFGRFAGVRFINPLL